MTTPTVLCLGEALVALTPTDATLREAAVLVPSVAGAELNVSVHLARLGLRTRFASRVGDDPFGDRVRDTLIAEGVDDTFLETVSGLPTGIYAKDPSPAGTTVYYYRAGSAASRMSRLDPTALAGVDLLHLSGITSALSGECAALITHLLTNASCRTSFDVNHRPALWSASDAAAPLLAVARLADIVFVGLDEAERLWGTTTPEAVRALLPSVGELVVRDGGTAAIAFVGDTETVEPALPVDIVEPVGAGDAFTAGYLHARLTGGSPAAALRQGHVVAGATLMHHSDHGGAPDPRWLDAARTGNGWPPKR